MGKNKYKIIGYVKHCLLFDFSKDNSRSTAAILMGHNIDKNISDNFRDDIKKQILRGRKTLTPPFCNGKKNKPGMYKYTLKNRISKTLHNSGTQDKRIKEILQKSNKLAESMYFKRTQCVAQLQIT